jgi:hypothetical protein
VIKRYFEQQNEFSTIYFELDENDQMTGWHSGDPEDDEQFAKAFMLGWNAKTEQRAAVKGHSEKGKRLSSDEIQDMHRMRRQGMTGAAIARQFGVTPQTVSYRLRLVEPAQSAT